MKFFFRSLFQRRPYISRKGKTGFVLHGRDGQCLTLDAELMAGTPTTLEVFFGEVGHWDSGCPISDQDRIEIREQIEFLLGDVYVVWR